MIHKCLKNHIAEGRLAAQRGTGITHPHHSRCNRQGDHRSLNCLKFGVELHKGNYDGHDGANIKGKLVCTDSTVTVGQGHDEEISDIQTDRQVGKEPHHPVFCLLGFFTEQERQQSGAAEGNEQIKNVPTVKQADLKTRIVFAE